MSGLSLRLERRKHCPLTYNWCAAQDDPFWLRLYAEERFSTLTPRSVPGLEKTKLVFWFRSKHERAVFEWVLENTYSRFDYLEEGSIRVSGIRFETLGDFTLCLVHFRHIMVTRVAVTGRSDEDEWLPPASEEI